MTDSAETKAAGERTISGRVFTYLCIAGLGVATVAGWLMFVQGFFPLRAAPSTVTRATAPAPHAYFDRLVFVVFDALRADFVTDPSSSFVWTRRAISEGHGLFFTTRAAAPTVTLPRLKALVSGTPPTFVDVVRNLAAGELREPNFVHEFLAQRAPDGHARTAVFYGDETWLKMFPHTFAPRSEGTTSFFVTDTETVDTNVTRHMERELGEGDWDALFLHLLGMDHIGHLQGAHSALMPAKQREYDALVHQIYDAVAATDTPARRTLVVVCGDHGMTDAGNHGGSTDAELDTVALFLSPAFATSSSSSSSSSSSPDTDTATGRDVFGMRASQVDVCPTLCALLGLPFPAENSGRVVPAVLRALEGDARARTETLRANAAQLRGVLAANGADGRVLALHDAAERAHAHAHAHAHASKDAEDRYEAFLAAASARLNGRWGAIDWYRVFVGAMVLGVATLGAVLLLWALLAPRGVLVAQRPRVRTTLAMLGVVTSLVCGAHLMVCSPSVGQQSPFFSSRGASGSQQQQQQPRVQQHLLSSACEDSAENLASVALCGVGLACALLPLLGVRPVRHFLLHRASAAATFDPATGRSGAIDAAARFVPPPYAERAETALAVAGTALHMLGYLGNSFVEAERRVVVFLLNTAYAFYLASLAAHGRAHAAALRRRAAAEAADPGARALVAQPNRVPRSVRTAFFALLGSCVAGRLVSAWDASRAAAWDLPVQRALFAAAAAALATYTCATLRAHRAFLGRARWVCLAPLALAYACVLRLKLATSVGTTGGASAEDIVLARVVIGSVAAALVVAVAWPRLGARGARTSAAALHITHALATHAALPLLLLYNQRANAALLALVVAQAALFVRAAAALDDGFCRPRTVFARTACLLWMARGAFFAFGNSNSIATIDLSGAYAGLTRYSAPAVGAQAFLLLYTGPLVVGAHLVRTCYALARSQDLRAPDALEQAALTAALTVAALYQLLPLATALAVLVLQHTHLFVWSVFAPKFVYASLDTVYAAVLVATLAACAVGARLHLIRYAARERRAYAQLRRRLEHEVESLQQPQQQPPSSVAVNADADAAAAAAADDDGAHAKPE